MSLYLDTSCLLKMFFPEPESAKVAALVAAEERVVVSTLAKLEATVQINARLDGGRLTRRKAGALVGRLEMLMTLAHYELVGATADLAAVAEAQIAPLGSKAHCRTLDRLHLAAMATLSLRRLLTNDDLQAAAATDLPFDVIMPR